MQTANHSLCAELYRLSGWSNTYSYEHIYTSDGYDEYEQPLYDLGYLLRKLNEDGWLELSTSMTAKWRICYEPHDTQEFSSEHGDTPEDAACKLAIELFKQGVLKRD